MEDILKHLQPEASVYADSLYNSHKAEGNSKNNHSIPMQAQQKSKGKRTDTKEQMQHKLKMRKGAEAIICNIKKLFSGTIHPVRPNGFLFKRTCFFVLSNLNTSLNYQLELFMFSQFATTFFHVFYILIIK